MTTEELNQIKALRYAVYLCETRKAQFKTEGYNVACDEIKLFLEAAIERLEHGEDMGGLTSVVS